MSRTKKSKRKAADLQPVPSENGAANDLGLENVGKKKRKLAKEQHVPAAVEEAALLPDSSLEPEEPSAKQEEKTLNAQIASGIVGDDKKPTNLTTNVVYIEAFQNVHQTGY